MRKLTSVYGDGGERWRWRDRDVEVYKEMDVMTLQLLFQHRAARLLLFKILNHVDSTYALLLLNLTLCVSRISYVCMYHSLYHAFYTSVLEPQ